jgi:hypothetical protein
MARPFLPFEPQWAEPTFALRARVIKRKIGEIVTATDLR